MIVNLENVHDCIEAYAEYMPNIFNTEYVSK